MPFVKSAKFPTALAGVADLANQKDAIPSAGPPVLDGNITDTATSFDVDDGSKLPADNFYITIEDEIIFVASRSGNTLSGCTRGAEGTANVAHNDQEEVNAYMIAVHHNQAAAEIGALEQELGAGLVNVFAWGRSPSALRRVSVGWADGTATWKLSGDSIFSAGGTYAAVAPNANNGVMLRVTTSTPQGSVGGVYSTLAAYRVSYNPFMRKAVLLEQITELRAFVGLTNQSLNTMVGADDPAGHYAGFQFSTDRPDSNWQCISKDGTTQEITDSGVAASTNLVLLEVEIVDGSHVKFYVNGTLVATHSTRLPGSTINLTYAVGLATRANPGAKSLLFGPLMVRSDR